MREEPDLAFVEASDVSLLRQTFDHAPIGVAVVSLDGRFVKVNRSLCELTGYVEADLLQKSFQDITHPDDLELDLEQAGKLLSGDIDCYEIEKRYLRSDGSALWILLTGTIVRIPRERRCISSRRSKTSLSASVSKRR